MRKLVVCSAVITAMLLVFIASGLTAAPKVEDFTFLQVSDVHAPMKQSGEVIGEIAALGEMELEPYKVTAKAPSFVIATGDLTEFGDWGGAWQQYLDYWQPVTLPVYHVPGNHDNTWNSIRYYLRSLPQGKSYYSFDKHGCHFIGLDSASVQDPMPSFPEEEIAWLKKDLAKVDPATPVFVFFHHPLHITEFASDYDKLRFADALKGHNIALIMGGHSHGVSHYKWGGLDCVMGGSTYGAKAGMLVLSVIDGTLRATYRKSGEARATEAVLEKPLAVPASPRISFSSPKDKMTYSGQIKAMLWVGLPKDSVKEAKWRLDGNLEGLLELKTGGSFQASVNTEGLVSGAHYLVATFTTSDGKTYQSSVMFYYDKGDSKLAWRTFIPASVKGQVAVNKGMVYVGGGDGKLYALKARHGKVSWTYQTGGEIISQPLVTGDSIYLTSGDGKLYCLDTKGKEKWSFAAKGPIYSSPVLTDGLVMFGSNDSTFYAVDAVKGTLAWSYEEPGYTIESKPFVKDGIVYFGAWDEYLYALNVKDGTLKWKAKGQGSSTQKAGRYYSAADCGPIVVGDKLFAADRNYDLSIMDAASGTLVSSLDTCSAVAASGDGTAVYLRRNKGDLTKIDLNGNPIWSVPVELNRIPTAPTEKDGVVYACSGNGLLSALAADTGRVLWSYRVVPFLWAYSGVEVQDGLAVIGGMDGSITAIKVASQ